jgi:hypothetical protein
MDKFMAFLDDPSRDSLTVADPNNCYDRLLFVKQQVSSSLCRIGGWVFTAKDERTIDGYPTGHLIGLYTPDSKQFRLFSELPKDSIALLRAFPKEYVSEYAAYWHMTGKMENHLKREIYQQCEARYGSTIVGNASALYDSSTCGALPNGLASDPKSGTTINHFCNGFALKEFIKQMVLYDANPFTGYACQNKCGADHPIMQHYEFEALEQAAAYLTDKSSWAKKYAENMLDDAETGPVLKRWFQGIQDMKAKYTELLTVPRGLPEQRLREIVLAIPREYRYPETENGKKSRRASITVEYTDPFAPEMATIAEKIYADEFSANMELSAAGITRPGHIIVDHIQRVLYNNTVLWEEPKGKATV